MDVNDELLDLILHFISHVLVYKYLKKKNIKKSQSDYGFSFPDKFTNEITKRTLMYQERYENLIGNKYDKNKLNNNLEIIVDKTNIDLKKNIIKLYDNIIPQINNYNYQDDDDSYINPDDISFNDIFLDIYENKSPSTINNNLEGDRKIKLYNY
jgi:hypothetical protein